MPATCVFGTAWGDEGKGGIVDLLTEDADIVVRTGGSAQIPIVHRMLTSKFPGKVVEYDVFKSIAAGLAIANYRSYAYQPE